MNVFKQKIEGLIVEALKASKVNELSILRDIKSQIVNAEKENKNQELDESQTFKVLEKMANKRKQSIEMFTQGNRTDLADKESFELNFLLSYLPSKMSIDQVKEAVLRIITENSLSTKKDMGKVIKSFNEQYAGQSDGKTISDICKEVLV
jgi:uncharacterized protein YqeY